MTLGARATLIARILRYRLPGPGRGRTFREGVRVRCHCGMQNAERNRGQATRDKQQATWGRVPICRPRAVEASPQDFIMIIACPRARCTPYPSLVSPKTCIETSRSTVTQANRTFPAARTGRRVPA